MIDFYKEDKTSKIWWVVTPDRIGEFLFSFDKKKIYNFFSDYPQKLNQEEIEIFKKECPMLVALKK